MMQFDRAQLARVQRNLARVGEAVPDLAAQGMVELAERILERAKMRDLMPYLTGELTDSGSVDVVNRGVFSGRYSTDVARIQFTAPHAVVQHNDTSLRHPNGGGPFFLTRAADEFTDGRGLEIVAGVVRGKLSGQVG